MKSKKFNCLIKDAVGKIYFKKNNVMAPATWSQTAVEIAASKYFRRSIKSEDSVFALVDRIGKGLKKAIKQSKLKSAKSNLINSVIDDILRQKAAFNSPVWFNVGLSEAYGLKSQSLHYRWSAGQKQVVAVNDAYSAPQSSACFIQSVEDSLESIFQLVQTEAKLFKYGSGSGTNFSNLRSKYEKLNSGGTSSGLISFLQVLDKSAGAIKSGGTTRRAAKMVCVNVDHPEILDFINWKSGEEKKAKILALNGYSADLDGEAYSTVSGQNANNSVRVTDKFMKAIEKKSIWMLKSTNGKIVKKLGAADIWKSLCQAAYDCADPGLQFHDTINRFHSCAQTTTIHASNPCSEYMFIDDSACNLASVNLVKFLQVDGRFDTSAFLETCQKFFTLQEALVDYSSYPTKKIAQNSHDYRPLGLGFANLGSLLMRKGLAYDSEEGRAWASAIAALMTGVAYKTSALIAKDCGPFPKYRSNSLSMKKVIRSHCNAVKKINWEFLPSELGAQVVQVWKDVETLGAKYGYRNAQATVIAPTGTIGLIMDCDTTGIEPEFSLIKIKKLSGGGEIKTVNQAVIATLEKLSYSKKEALVIKQQLMETGSILKTNLKPVHFAVFATAVGDNLISPMGHLKMMAAVQPFISGAISKTVNLPAHATLDDISRLYFQAWTMNLKSVALYRDGSKFIQPLNKGSNQAGNPFPKCGECGHDTVLESGCFRCVNCGSTSACSG